MAILNEPPCETGRPSDRLIIDAVNHRVKLWRGNGPKYVYKAEQLCIDIWQSFDGQHVYIGKRIKALADDGILPIEPAAKTSDNIWLYRIQ
jgi:hypothetical protein